jgi:hypothetical protein
MSIHDRGDWFSVIYSDDEVDIVYKNALNPYVEGCIMDFDSNTFDNIFEIASYIHAIYPYFPLNLELRKAFYSRMNYVRGLSIKKNDDILIKPIR